MIGLDTNVVVRHLTDDDADQSPVAHRIFESLSGERPGYLSFATLLETHWVLRRSYRYSREVVASVVDALLSTSDLVIEGADQVRQALQAARVLGGELPDVLVAQ
ncbi:MAG: PIN domain-containing protein, partial [Propionibacteriaceae bacterium]|nr:PIN domain-containing protein [Propionibacteriaceae bacterium]